MRISLCLLNFYEDWLCARAISQVYNYVDEIVIGDGSRGKDLLKDFVKGLPKCRIVPDPDFDLEGENFSWSQWRNYVQSFARGDWILWQDPDELFPLLLIKNLKSWLEKVEVEAIGFMRVAHTDNKRMKEKSREMKIRCWRNLERIRWSGNVHEYPIGYKTFSVLEIDYFHDHWVNSFSQWLYKLRKQEKRGNLIPRLKEELDLWRALVPDEKEKEIFESRE